MRVGHTCDSLGAVNPTSATQQKPSIVRTQKRRVSVWMIVLVALVLRVLVITVGHTYRITPRRDHFQFGWETGRIARSIALGQGYASPTDLQTGPT
ncbi:MAG TPA: hypothetical protein VFM77_03475, partial [Terriglobales bacterium]|nr:hypothetical protein [Terriglobales bacterium]